MAATAIHRLTLDPMEKCSNAFFSETTNMIKAKLYMNVHWMVVYKIYVFCSDMKIKMAATAGLSYEHSCSLALIIFVVSEKKAFEHFPMGSNVTRCVGVAAILVF
jgi:CRISPR/Cas system type I-B associated protein Csh2 (Cas7 group RAMP superfamily)